MLSPHRVTAFPNIAILLLVAVITLGTWWLSGIDQTGSENRRGWYFFRALRCSVVLFLVGVFLWFIEQRNSGYGGVPLLIIIPIGIVLIMRGNLAEFFAHGFMRMVDPAFYDDRALDLKKAERQMDVLAHLINSGQRDRAIKLCEDLKRTGEVDETTLEMTLEFLGVKPERAPQRKPLQEAAQLQTQGRFAKAEQVLHLLLKQNPADIGAAMLLLRLYAQDLRQPGKAAMVLRELEKQPGVAAGYVEFARRSVDEWNRTPVKAVPVSEPPKIESVEELLAQKFYGSAVELLENQIKAQPQDFELRLKLAEVQALHCHNLARAEKIVRQLETDVTLSAVQIASAREKLKLWQERSLSLK